jgi:hypothetical protein
MPSITTHIIPKDDGWVIINEGSLKRKSIVYSTQKQALAVAVENVQRAPAAQVVVHGRTGSMRRRYVHGLPAVQKSRVKSDLGTENIRRAVSAVIRERLQGK